MANSRLIDAEALKAFIQKYDYQVSNIDNFGRGMFTENILYAIDEQPTVSEPITDGQKSQSRILLVPLNQTIDDVIDIIHKTVYDFLINTDPESEYMTDKHDLLLKVNKTLCNEIEKMKE